MTVPVQRETNHIDTSESHPEKCAEHEAYDHAEKVPSPLLGSCPLPIFQHKNIVLGHGSGGKLTSELIDKVFLRAFANPILEKLDDHAVLEIGDSRLAFTTDSFVVTPIFFPGGDIGTLAINGTVNDLAMSGARPLYLAAAFILEEGLPAEELRRVVESMATAAREAGVQMVTGDTKVVNRGKGDKLFITTTGIGAIEHAVNISASRARPGDKILLSGYIGDHGMAIMSQRENLEFEGAIESDCAALHALVHCMLDACDAVAGQRAADHPIHCMRDPTRGGVATTLNEIASQSKVGMFLREDQIPVRDSVQGACEILGLDPMYVANEGKLVAVVAAESAGAILQQMQNHPLGREAKMIGEVVSEHPGMVRMETRVGGTRILDVMFGEQLPRIC
ncbi:MAG TPA: hydrogenase expression/formation protein HypE [Acidobacteriaceae bacterium]|nr:hydrogenase expression/formation protein HypE [Acidobacteriaceae bacterium]